MKPVMSMKAKVTDDDREFRRLMRRLAERNRAVEIGLFGAENSAEIEKGITNEFGSADGTVPERSFVRATMVRNANRYQEAARRGWMRVLEGRLTVSDVLQRMGILIQGDIRGTIGSNVPPPNAPATVLRKTRGKGGQVTTLIDTGRMRAAIDWRLAE